MIQDRKIDLALEAKELAEGSAAQTTRLAGVKAQEDTVFGYPLTRVEILNREGEAALGKPKGTYLTLELPQLPREREEVLRAARGVAAVLEALPTLPKQGSVLVAGLGNRRVTPDAIGPRATDFLLVTRHLVQTMPQDFSALRPVSALAAGVTGTTGIESGELIGAVVKKLKPACLIAVDALAARREELQGELDRRKTEYEAISIALDALKRANTQLQERFSPELNRRAGEWMARLTGGKYAAVSLTRELEAAALERDSVLPRRSLALSRGTVDQLYLAVRLAVCQLCLPGEDPAPLVLDDALVTFDDRRMALALDALAELGRERQILLFTCQEREGNYLEGRPGVTRTALRGGGA